MNSCVIFVDGASSGNPGRSGAGFLIFSQGKLIKKASLCTGIKTNNQAEYLALIHALKSAMAVGFENVTVYSDSKLLVMQVKGIYRVKSENLKPLHREALGIIKMFSFFEIRHIGREKNKEADKLAKAGVRSCP